MNRQQKDLCITFAIILVLFLFFNLGGIRFRNFGNAVSGSLKVNGKPLLIEWGAIALVFGIFMFLFRTKD